MAPSPWSSQRWFGSPPPPHTGRADSWPSTRANENTHITQTALPWAVRGENAPPAHDWTADPELCLKYFSSGHSWGYSNERVMPRKNMLDFKKEVLFYSCEGDFLLTCNFKAVVCFE